MNTQNNKTKNNWITAIKVFLASLSITSLFGLWNLFSKNAQETATETTTTSDTDTLASALPTLVPSNSNSETSSQSTQELAQVTVEEAQATAAPVIERVVVGSSGSSRSGAPAAKTSSS